jgi:hypothetical protein
MTLLELRFLPFIFATALALRLGLSEADQGRELRMNGQDVLLGQVYEDPREYAAARESLTAVLFGRTRRVLASGRLTVAAMIAMAGLPEKCVRLGWDADHHQFGIVLAQRPEQRLPFRGVRVQRFTHPRRSPIPPRFLLTL